MRTHLIPVLSLLLFLIAAPAFCSVSFNVSNISGNSWEYNYTLSGIPLVAGDFVAIYFDFNVVSGMSDPCGSPSDDPCTLPADPSEWDVQGFQPDPGFSQDGEYDAIALVDTPSLAVMFTEEFTYTGTPPPGAQEFAIFDSNFNEIGSGVTSMESAAPEPASMTLLAVGLAYLAAKRRLRRPS